MSDATPPITPQPTPPQGVTLEWPAWLRRLVLLQPGEASAFLWAAGYFFFLLFSYYLLRPVRDTIGIRGELDKLPWLWTATTVATLVISPLFALVVSRLPRRRFVPWLYRVIALVLLGFWIALRAAGPKDLAIGYAFFVWVSVYNLLSTSVFWGFMADVFTQEQGKRLFGAIGIGGTLGAILGGVIPAWWAPVIGPINLILLSVVLLEVVAQCVRGLCRQDGLMVRPSAAAGPSPALANMPSREPSRNIWEGFVLIAKSPYLQLMVLYMLLFTICSTFLEFEQARVIKTSVTDEAQRTQTYSTINTGVNILTVLTQMFLTGRILTFSRGRGIMIGLLLLPVLTVVGFSALWRWETIGVLMTVQIVRRAMHYAVDRPTREVLYTVLGPDAKYKSKSFIDTFVYRSGDLAGAWTTWMCNHLAFAVSLAGMIAAGAWLGGGLALGWMQRRVAARAAAENPLHSSPSPAGR